MDFEVELTERIIGCAIEVHRALGPGLLESVYKRALCLEFAHNQLRFERERHIPLRYRDAPLGEYQVDLIVENRVVVEVKSVRLTHEFQQRRVKGRHQAVRSLIGHGGTKTRRQFLKYQCC